jgi:hypothetical protein
MIELELEKASTKKCFNRSKYLLPKKEEEKLKRNLITSLEIRNQIVIQVSYD